MLSLEQPSPTVLQSIALRVDGGSATYGDVLKTLYTSATVTQQSPADELARMFFLALNRAPDAPLFNAMMDQLRAGKSLADMAAFMLAAPGFALSDAGFPRHESFVSALLARTLGSGFTPDLASTLTGFLNDGVLSRAQMLAVVSGLPGVAVAPQARVETALLYLAGAGREATTQELDLAPTTTDARIIKALTAGGVSATGGALALYREGDAVQVYSELAADLVWNAATNVYTYGGKSSFKVFYSTDGGLTGALVDFVPEMARGVTELDASAALGKGSLFYTAGTSGAAEVMGPLGGLVFTGGKLADVAVGSVGADTFYIAAGADTLTGGAGDDRFVLPASTAYQGAGGAGGHDHHRFRQRQGCTGFLAAAEQVGRHFGPGGRDGRRSPHGGAARGQWRDCAGGKQRRVGDRHGQQHGVPCGHGGRCGGLVWRGQAVWHAHAGDQVGSDHGRHAQQRRCVAGAE